MSARQYQIIRGRDTRQIDGVTCRPADPRRWYYEAIDYDGDVLWSESYATRAEAEAAATEEAHHDDI